MMRRAGSGKRPIKNLLPGKEVGFGRSRFGDVAKSPRFFDELFQGFDRVVVGALFAKSCDGQHELAGGLAVGHLAGKSISSSTVS